MTAIQIIGIDPGPKIQTIVMFDGTRVNECLDVGIDEAIKYLQAHSECLQVCEWIDCYGMPVGSEVFRTVFNIGRMFHAVTANGGIMRLIPRRDIKLALCNNGRAKDPNVRRALLELLGPVGTVKNPGPCYGVANHRWSALAAAVVGVQCERTKNEVFGNHVSDTVRFPSHVGGAAE